VEVDYHLQNQNGHCCIPMPWQSLRYLAVVAPTLLPSAVVVRITVPIRHFAWLRIRQRDRTPEYTVIHSSTCWPHLTPPRSACPASINRFRSLNRSSKTPRQRRRRLIRIRIHIRQPRRPP